MTARFWIAAGLLSSLGTLAVSAAPSKVPLRRKAPPVRPAARRQLPLKNAVSVDPGTRAMTLDEARTAVAMLGDAYDLLLEETHSVYHTRPSTPVAATVVRKLQARMKLRARGDKSDAAREKCRNRRMGQRREKSAWSGANLWKRPTTVLQSPLLASN